MRARFLFTDQRSSPAVLAAFLAGCGGAQIAPGVAGVAAPSAGRATHAWIKPGASSGDLLYASAYNGQNQILILSYPQGVQVGSLDAPAAGMCSDTQGNVYLVYLNGVTEYAHGGTQPIRTVHVPGSQTETCAVDPTTGNLAVTFYCPPCGNEDLAIFPPGSSQSTRYEAPEFGTVGYDNQGNLFITSYESGSSLGELPAGGTEIVYVYLNENIGQPGQVQWDGTYITLQNIKTPSTISRISISGTSGTVVSQTKFGLYMRKVGYSWISGDGTVTFPLSTKGGETNEIGIWKYPKAPHIMKILKKLGTIGYLTVSVAPSGLRTKR